MLLALVTGMADLHSLKIDKKVGTGKVFSSSARFMYLASSKLDFNSFPVYKSFYSRFFHFIFLSRLIKLFKNEIM